MQAGAPNNPFSLQFYLLYFVHVYVRARLCACVCAYLLWNQANEVHTNALKRILH